MVQTLEQYVSEATNAYKPAANAIQSQIDSLQGNLDTTNEIINRDYAQQQANLNLASNQAAEAASMQAAGNGGSFGGAGNLARRKYYEQSFVPAVTQLQTNRANDLASARQASENTKLQLNQKLADIQSQAANQATQQYYTATEAQAGRDFQAAQAELDRNFNEAQAQLNREWQDYLNDKQYKHEAVEAEKVRQFQAEQDRLNREYQAEQARLDREFQAQQNAASRALSWAQYNDQKAAAQALAEQQRKNYTLDSQQNVYGGYNWRDANGNPVTIAEVAKNTPGDFNDNLYQRLRQAASNGSGDRYSALVYNMMSDGAKFAPNTGGSTGNSVYDTLGIRRIN